MSQPHNKPNYLQSFKAGSDLSSSQFVALKVDADDDVSVAADGEGFIGFLMNKPLANEACEIAGPGGGGVGIAAGAIARGDRLKVDSSGHLVAISSETAIMVAIADDDAADNDEFAVIVTTPANVTIS